MEVPQVHLTLCCSVHWLSVFQDDFVGMMSIADHEDAISDAAFSPDGTALATASLDGQVKLFVYFQLLFVYYF